MRISSSITRIVEGMGLPLPDRLMPSPAGGPELRRFGATHTNDKAARIFVPPPETHTENAPSFSGLPGSRPRHVALQHDAIKVARLPHVVVAVRLVQQAAVVPHHEVARLPAMAILEPFGRGVPQQLVEQRQGLLVVQAEDAF